ncbi:MAG: GDSL-type esterase/lipase family protein [Opitutaceae bacterium]|jgi:lysophospholipase L1-like esterase
MKKYLLSALALLFLAVSQTVSKPATPVETGTAASKNVSADPFWPADGVFPVPGRTSSWTGFRAHNIERRTQFAERRAIDQQAIVFVGDSITAGWKTLEKDFAGLGVKVANRGIGGDTTPHLIYRLQEDVLSLHPRALVILIGTNDLGEHTSPEQITANLRVLHALIRASYPEIPIAWCLVMPRTGDDTYPERIRDLNARIAKLVESDHRATLCDTFTPLAQPDGTSIPECYSPDRLHLNETGYVRWRSVLHPVLSSWNLQAK